MGWRGIVEGLHDGGRADRETPAWHRRYHGHAEGNAEEHATRSPPSRVVPLGLSDSPTQALPIRCVRHRAKVGLVLQGERKRGP